MFGKVENCPKAEKQDKDLKPGGKKHKFDITAGLILISPMEVCSCNKTEQTSSIHFTSQIKIPVLNFQILFS